MRAEYDSRADALQIYLTDATEWAGGEEVAGHQVDFDTDGHPAGVEVLSPGGGLDGLSAVAERFGLDSQALVAAARAALAAPDRQVTVAVAAKAAA